MNIEEVLSTQMTRLVNAHKKLDRLRERMEVLLGGADHDRKANQNIDKGTQILLSLKYRDLAAKGVTLPFDEVGFRNYSQTSEDGILLYIFSLIGTSNRRAVELGCGPGFESNTANLAVNHNWDVLMVDGSKANVELARRFFGKHPDTRIFGHQVVREWIDRESVNATLEKYGLSGEIDLFSLDVDGVDYWIWEALTVISPRVVVVEYNFSLGERCVTVPYRADFVSEWNTESLFAEDTENEPSHVGAVTSRFCYGGASLRAMVKLAKTKGYRLVGTDGQGFNAFFIRNDITQELFPEIDVSTVSPPSRIPKAYRDFAEKKLAEKEWVEV